MSPIPGTIPLTGEIAPTDTTDTYPTHDAQYGLDGHRSVADHTTRNAITTARRRTGMLVFTQDDGITWQLKASPWAGDDTDWKEFHNSTAPTGVYVPPIAFSHGDAPRFVFTPLFDGTFTLARADVLVAFNGASPTIKVGTAGSGEAILAAADIDATQIGGYERAADFAVLAGTGVWLEITAVGSSVGSGILYLSFVPSE